MEICDSPVICESCYKLLKSAYKFRLICVQTEEKIYQYIEKNNLRLGESIDLNNLSEKYTIKYEDSVNIEVPNIKEESNMSEELEHRPILYPDIELRDEISHEPQLIIKLCQISNSDKKNVEHNHKILSTNEAQSILDTYPEKLEKSKFVYI